MPRGSKKCAGKTLHKGPRGGLYCIVEGGKKYYVAARDAKPVRARAVTPVAAAPAAKAKKPARPKTPTLQHMRPEPPAVVVEKKAPKEQVPAGSTQEVEKDPILRFLLANQRKTNKHCFWFVDKNGKTDFPETRSNVLETKGGRPVPSARKVLDEYPNVNHLAVFFNSKDVKTIYFMGMRDNGEPYWVERHGKWAKAHEDLILNILDTDEVNNHNDV